MTLPVALTISRVILGMEDGINGLKKQRCNMLLILAKYFIWICKVNNETVHITSFYKYLANYIAMQKYIAKIEGKERQFTDMWNEIQGRTSRLLGERDVPSRLSP